ncbi:GntR family transcriptional regulator [Streptomyces odontomachi]|uniref:GntR family transcriptional regulator n=1 Tax=Streptomyces odontomachi TaxID=2944940 RepID=UPI00210D781E|nr:GntR family transcriptional regulator [Streptomyces sp. ODS25]
MADVKHRHEEIAEALRADIAAGTYPAGKALPAETQLAHRFGASVPTVRLALGRLQNDGLIEKVPGNGNYVLRPFERITYTNDKSVTDGLTPTTTTLTVEITTTEVEADVQLSTQLRVPVGTRLNRYVFLSRQGTSPHSLAQVYVPCSVAELTVPPTGWSPLGDDIRAQLVDRGIRPTSTVVHIAARLPEPSEERQLRIGSGTAVLAIRRRSMDADGRVIEAAVLVLPGHRSEAVFSTHMPVDEAEAKK